MRLLVTGGTGYIGSVVAALLAGAGHEVVVIDDLSTGHADAVPAAAVFVKGSVRDHAQAVLANGADAVLHFAAKSDRKSTRLNSSHIQKSRMPSSA